MLLLYIFYCVISFSYVISEEYAPIVATNVGKVRGLVKTLEDGTRVYLYEGIRYGESTDGERRFTKPIPTKQWNGIYDATKVRHKCMQKSGGITGDADPPSFSTPSEDCLFLSIYSPAKLSETKRPVMFFIHGGGFESGTIFTLAYDGRYLATYGDVIVVTINYRLGPFGFLYGGTDDAPGNVGLLDQVLALKWVHQNIEAFGGDPNSITIFGQSAGGMSVGAHILSPQTTGLFKRAILQSGAPNSYLGSLSHEESLKKTKDMAIELQCNYTTVPDMVKCLRHKDTNSIIKYVSRGMLNGANFQPIYGDQFMPVKPSIALRDGKFNRNIDILFGSVNNEGSLFVTEIFKDLDPHKTPTITVTKAVAYINLMFTLMQQSFASTVGPFYTSELKDNNNTDSISRSIAASFGDFHITCPTILFGSAFSKYITSNHAYAYRLSHSPAIAAIPKCIGWMGVCHADDVIYIFGFPIALRGITYTENDYKLSKDMINIWSTFAKTGKPPSLDGVEWTEAIDRLISNPSVQFMDLYPGKYRIIKNGYKKTCEGFWKTYLM